MSSRASSETIAAVGVAGALLGILPGVLLDVAGAAGLTQQILMAEYQIAWRLVVSTLAVLAALPLLMRIASAGEIVVLCGVAGVLVPFADLIARFVFCTPGGAGTVPFVPLLFRTFPVTWWLLAVTLLGYVFRQLRISTGETHGDADGDVNGADRQENDQVSDRSR